jgi:hypothetical protein
MPIFFFVIRVAAFSSFFLSLFLFSITFLFFVVFSLLLFLFYLLLGIHYTYRAPWHVQHYIM